MNRILKIAGKPLTNLEIIYQLSGDGHGQTNANSVRSRLSSDGRNGRIKHLAKGLYASVDFDEASYELPPQLTIVERIVHILETAGEPLTNEEVACRLNDDLCGQVCRGSVSSRLSVARDRQMIQRLGHGLYASSAFDERISGRPIKKTTLPSIIVRVINNVGRPLNAEAITIASIEESGREYKKDSVVHALVKACRQGDIKRVAPGYYASVDFEGSFQPPQTENIEKRFLKLLAEGGEMEIPDIIGGLKADGQPPVVAGSLINQLGISCREGRIKRLGKGLYASVDFESPDLSPEKLKARTLAVLEAAGKPLARKEIFAGLNREGEAPIKPSRVKHILRRAGERGEVKRLRRGVYVRVSGAVEADRPTSSVSLKQRVKRLLETAARPMAFMEIASELSHEDLGEPNLDSLRSRLSAGCRAGIFIRLKKGLYAPADYVSSDHDRPPRRETRTQLMVRAIEAADKPMSARAVVCRSRPAIFERGYKKSPQPIGAYLRTGEDTTLGERLLCRHKLRGLVRCRSDQSPQRQGIGDAGKLRSTDVSERSGRRFGERKFQAGQSFQRQILFKQSLCPRGYNTSAARALRQPEFVIGEF